MLDAVGIELGVGYLEVNDGVYLHGDVILGDNGLGREVGDLLLEGDDLCDPLNKRDLDVDAGAPGDLVRAEAFNDISLALLHHADIPHDNDKHEDDNSV